ncbi:MAG: hypothetical protein AAFX06_12765 [Planctomycetota bacterium]
MALWLVNDWYAVVKRGPEQRRLELSRPFALIGRHESCDVTINDRHSAAVAYIAVAYDRYIEVWPTCPLAFSMWGRIKRPETELLIGKSRVSLGWSGPPGSPEQRDWKPNADLLIDWGRGERRRQITRPVSILGEDHPSVIRLHGTDLDRCDQAVICFGETIWMIDLCASRWGKDGPVCREMAATDTSVYLSGLHLWCATKSDSETKRIKSTSATSPRLDVVMENTDPEVDEITTRWTDSLLETTARRGERAKQFRRIGYVCILAIALVLVAIIIIQGFAPILRSIYGE